MRQCQVGDLHQCRDYCKIIRELQKTSSKKLMPSRILPWKFGQTLDEVFNIWIQDDDIGMAILPHPAPQRWWGGDGARFQPRTTGWGGDGFRLFRLTLPHPFLSPSQPALLRIIIVYFLYLKTLLFKQTYQYYLILFYPI